VLLPAGRAATDASGPALRRALALDALAVVRLLRDRPRDAGLWGEPAFAREVDTVRRQLAPIESRRALMSSFAREAFRTASLAGQAARPGPQLTPVRLAYVVRWLELGGPGRRAGWSGTGADGA
jgi:hypothetical protein